MSAAALTLHTLTSARSDGSFESRAPLFMPRRQSEATNISITASIFENTSLKILYRAQHKFQRMSVWLTQNTVKMMLLVLEYGTAWPSFFVLLCPRANMKTGTYHCPATCSSDASPVDPSAGGSCWVTPVQAGSAPTFSCYS